MIRKLMLLSVLALVGVACNSGVGVYVYEDSYYDDPFCSVGDIFCDPWYDPYDPWNDPWYSGAPQNEGTQGESRDILTQVGQQQEQKIEEAGHKLASRFNLDAEVGVKVIRAMDGFRKISKTRERTKADLDQLTARTLGLQFDEFASVVSAKDAKQVDELVDRSALHLKTSPENVRNILDTLYQD
jgi:hypothetical protein